MTTDQCIRIARILDEATDLTLKAQRVIRPDYMAGRDMPPSPEIKEASRALQIAVRAILESAPINSAKTKAMHRAAKGGK